MHLCMYPAEDITAKSLEKQMLSFIRFAYMCIYTHMYIYIYIYIYIYALCVLFFPISDLTYLF